jgi:hypothetical protein
MVLQGKYREHRQARQPGHEFEVLRILPGSGCEAYAKPRPLWHNHALQKAGIRKK